MYFTLALFVLCLLIDIICYEYYIVAYSSHCNLYLRFWYVKGSGIFPKAPLSLQ